MISTFKILGLFFLMEFFKMIEASGSRNDTKIGSAEMKEFDFVSKGACTNHVDRILGNFTPSTHVDIFKY